MQLFYSSEISGNRLILTGDDHRHATKVLRKKLRDPIIITDGHGIKYTGEITEIRRNETEVSIFEKEEVHHNGPTISIAIAPTKNMSRFEWFLEKATEIGVQNIYPIYTKYSERKVLKTERCNKLLIGAMKQSQQFHQPKLSELLRWSDFIKQEFKGQKYIAYVDHENHQLALNYDGSEDVLILIGPEGDFSKEEIDEAFANGFKAVSLGRNRLRTETAGVVAVQILNGIIDNKNNS